MTRTMTIELDLPPKVLSPNARAHWAKVASAKKKYRKAAALIAKAAGTARFTRARMDLDFYVRDRRGLRQDSDNLVSCMKAGRDGIADAGVVENDRDITIGKVRLAVDPNRPRVVVTLTEIGPCA